MDGYDSQGGKTSSSLTTGKSKSKRAEESEQLVQVRKRIGEADVRSRRCLSMCLHSMCLRASERAGERKGGGRWEGSGFESSYGHRFGQFS
jgi:hypothetical protein